MADARTALLAHASDDGLLLETAEALLERGWRVAVAMPDATGPLAREVRRLGAETSRLDPRLPLPGLLRSREADARRIDALLLRVRPDAVHVSPRTSPLWIARARAHGVPVVCRLDEPPAGDVLLADRLVVGTPSARSALAVADPALPGRTDVIPDGVGAPEHVVPPRAALTGPVRLLHPGPVSAAAGADVAVEALALLVASGVDAILELAGNDLPEDDGFADRLRARAAADDLAGRVRRTAAAADWDGLARADVVVVPSREARAGGSALSAVLAARPVVVATAPGLAEPVDGVASALQVAPGDALALAQALHRIVSNWPAFRRSAAALGPVAARRHAPDRYRRDIAGAIEAVLPGRDEAVPA